MKIICIGRNYSEHARELGNEVPEDPVIFMKPKTALLLPGKPLYYPEFTKDLHYECELVVRMSKNGKHISEKFANKYYEEVSLGIDFTARDVQQKLKQKGLSWELAKAFDGSAAVGKFMKIGERNIQQLNFELQLNKIVVQRGNTADMLFPVDKIIAFASEYFTLNIGDILFTGTPAGVGPLKVDDDMEGYLEGERVLEVSVK